MSSAFALLAAKSTLSSPVLLGDEDVAHVARLGRPVLRLVLRVVREDLLVGHLHALRDLVEDLLRERRHRERLLAVLLGGEALRLERLLVLGALAVEAGLDELLLGLVDVLVGHRDAELVGRLPELLELDEVRDVLRLDALVLGRSGLRELLLLRLVALLRLRDELVEVVLRDLRAVDDGDRSRGDAVGAAAARRRDERQRGEEDSESDAREGHERPCLIAKRVLGKGCDLDRNVRGSGSPHKKGRGYAARAWTIASGSSSASERVSTRSETSRFDVE